MIKINLEKDWTESVWSLALFFYKEKHMEKKIRKDLTNLRQKIKEKLGRYSCRTQFIRNQYEKLSKDNTLDRNSQNDFYTNVMKINEFYREYHCNILIISSKYSVSDLSVANDWEKLMIYILCEIPLHFKFKTWSEMNQFQKESEELFYIRRMIKMAFILYSIDRKIAKLLKKEEFRAL